jgi:hypothetical protein
MDYYIKYEQPNNTCSRERINVGRMAHNYIVSWGEFLSFLLAFLGVYYRGYASPKTALFFQILTANRALISLQLNVTAFKPRHIEGELGELFGFGNRHS